jgi:hypothetical protein
MPTDIVSVTDFMTSAQRADYLGNTASLDLSGPLNTAFATTGRLVFLPSGTARVDSNLNKPVCSGIFGEGETVSIIKAGSGVTKVLSLGADCVAARDFQVFGNNTSDARGIVFGDGEVSSYAIERVRVLQFNGASAVGIHFKDVLKSTITKLTTAGNTTNVLLQGDSGLPTTLSFQTLYVGTATGVGMKILTGAGITFDGLIIESNAHEGVTVAPTVGDAVDITFNDIWSEDNNGNVATEYDIVCSATARTARVIVNGGYFSGGARSIRMTGSGCVGFEIDKPQVRIADNQIVVDSSAYGRVALPPNLIAYFDQIVSATTGGSAFNTNGIELPWTSWTPTYSSDVGNEAATFTSAPSTSLARYKRIGYSVTVNVQFSGTLRAVSPAIINMTLPTGLRSYTNTLYVPAMVNVGSLNGIGILRTDGGGGLSVYAPGFASYTSGATVNIAFALTFELQ